jgi:hypothetical protein
MIASAEMPRYQCHKKVWALRLSDVEINNDTGEARLTPMGRVYAPFDAPDGWSKRYHGSDDDTGYYVVYDDGYASWSPTKAFEDGYSRI